MVSELGQSEFEPIDPECAHDAVVARIGREVMAEMRGGQPLSRLRIDALGQDLAIQLLRRWSNLAGTRALTRELARGGLAPWQVRRVTEYMEGRLADDVSLGDLSKLLNLSEFHLCRAFRQSTGLPPHGYLRQLRSERAKALLIGTSLSIGEIAAEVGYETPQAFARMFRAEVGASPREYRRDRRS